MPEENVSKSLFEANAAINAQEFANRQILLSGNGIPTSQHHWVQNTSTNQLIQLLPIIK